MIFTPRRGSPAFSFPGSRLSPFPFPSPCPFPMAFLSARSNGAMRRWGSGTVDPASAFAPASAGRPATHSGRRLAVDVPLEITRTEGCTSSALASTSAHPTRGFTRSRSMAEMVDYGMSVPRTSGPGGGCVEPTICAANRKSAAERTLTRHAARARAPDRVLKAHLRNSRL